MSDTTFPLGPWAGAEVQFRQTRAGTTLHGDPECGIIRGRDTSEATFPQPQEGSIDNLVLPKRSHCTPGGRLGAYLRAVENIRARAREASEIATAVAAGDLPLRALVAIKDPRRDLDPIDAETLAPAWSSAYARWQHVVNDVAERHRNDSQVLRRMIIATWILTGRTPREYRPRFAELSYTGSTILDAHGLSATPELLVHRILVPWLTHLAAGVTPRRAAELITVEHQSQVAQFRPEDDLLQRKIARGIDAAAVTWLAMIDAIDTAHRPRTVIFAERRPYGAAADLIDACLTLHGGAELPTNWHSWVVTQAPEVLSLLLSPVGGHDHALILDRSPWATFDPANAQRRLRGLLLAIEHSELLNLVLPREPRPRMEPNPALDHVPDWPRRFPADTFTSTIPAAGTSIPVTPPPWAIRRRSARAGRGRGPSEPMRLLAAL